MKVLTIVSAVAVAALVGFLLWLLLREKPKEKVTARLVPLITPDLAADIATGKRAGFGTPEPCCPEGYDLYQGVGSGSRFWCVAQSTASAGGLSPSVPDPIPRSHEPQGPPARQCADGRWISLFDLCPEDIVV